jgi:hypothetical protein
MNEVGKEEDICGCKKERVFIQYVSFFSYFLGVLHPQNAFVRTKFNQWFNNVAKMCVLSFDLLAICRLFVIHNCLKLKNHPHLLLYFMLLKYLAKATFIFTPISFISIMPQNAETMAPCKTRRVLRSGDQVRLASRVALR